MKKSNHEYCLMKYEMFEYILIESLPLKAAGEFLHNNVKVVSYMT